MRSDSRKIGGRLVNRTKTVFELTGKRPKELFMGMSNLLTIKPIKPIKASIAAACSA
jgi:hypothetical protein